MREIKLNSRKWNSRHLEKEKKLEDVLKIFKGKIIPADKIVDVMENVIYPGNIVTLEGDNQKQASFLSRALLNVDRRKVNNLHMVMSNISRDEHLEIFKKGIASMLDFSYAGSQSVKVSNMLKEGSLEIGDVHTYLELYSRLFVDLIPDITLVAAEKADGEGNLYTGPNTEETSVLVEAAAFHDGIVIAQVNEIDNHLPRVDIPGSWVDFIVESDVPYDIDPLFTRDPAKINEVQILIAMMVIKGIYAKHHVLSLNHGIGYNTAAIELLLPTYGELLGLKGKICTNWVLNPHPTLIPAVESGWVKSVYSFGGELGMEKYVSSRSDVFFDGKDGSLRSNRVYAQMAGQYALDAFVGSTLQIDSMGNSSTVTEGRLSGFGGAPNMGSDSRGRRHSTEAWLDMAVCGGEIQKGRKLVIQTVETFKRGDNPVFVDKLDAVKVRSDSGLPITPVMIYGDDITHVVSEEGIAYLYKAQNLDERKKALAAIAGVTGPGLSITDDEVYALRRKGLVAYPEDIGIKRTDAKRSLLAAKDIEDLVQWSQGLYEPPAKFKNW
ncbi:malonate decarboxylase subunit alpha [Clostridium luticellarii]|jgi:malonate decarboxylase alpha subunit|uniref:malonate decarboxylase subunit alpha n=1 Tax=Clostridium luticellarii TaxID=1691940 RepID=UPI0023569795|nr:malonate decarboxylase subunit alpha [Clostridium luticellarii]MCI1944389.1 malonate decarboxylase subunit alpha [Clostridium luticellarii]MCI1967509.1 malonate decarboxylase subunit alpha [Clostridium luticellarii]MCI1995021.1 malonate decarboxylase subunit alpha [Clostridium luticellarii]MCI2039540.1 malonate decarboxylase subunit alpha [Clostridium luticellarii]